MKWIKYEIGNQTPTPRRHRDTSPVGTNLTGVPRAKRLNDIPFIPTGIHRYSRADGHEMQLKKKKGVDV
jgi:hypothetical protein